VDFAFPGNNMLNTLPGNTYGSYSGISIAMPHAAAVAALSHGPHKEPEHHP